MTAPPILKTFQVNAVNEAKPLLCNNGSLLLIGQTGSGKTFILGQLLKDIESTLTNPSDLILYLTAAPVVYQTQKKLIGNFGIQKVLVLNYDALRSNIGTMFIDWIEVNPFLKPYTPEELTELKEWASEEQILELVKQRENLIDESTPYWKPHVMPKAIFCDESHKLRNEKTQQTQIIEQYLKQGGQVMLASATPFSKVSEAKITCLALKPKVRNPELGISVPLNHTLWPSFAAEIAGPRSKPWEANAEAMQRLKEALDFRTVRLKNVRFPHKCFSHCKLISFQSKEDRIYYDEAYNDYIKMLAKIDRDAPGGIAEIWTASLKFRMRSEEIRAPYLADHSISIKNLGKQVIIASNFIETLSKVKNRLLEKGVSSNSISIIIGGQKSKERERNIDLFQTGKTDYLLLTLKTGGVGLDLPHCEENRHLCRPRYIVIPPTWSPIELVQALGRPHRLNSISDTHADIIWFKDTEEENVAINLEPKLNSLSTLIASRESWMGVFSRRADLNNIKELADLSINESCDIDEDGDIEILNIGDEI